MDRTVKPTAAEKPGIGRVNDGTNLQASHIAAPDGEISALVGSKGRDCIHTNNWISRKYPYPMYQIYTRDQGNQEQQQVINIHLEAVDQVLKAGVVLPISLSNPPLNNIDKGDASAG
jgi:hypothetical protein